MKSFGVVTAVAYLLVACSSPSASIDGEGAGAEADAGAAPQSAPPGAGDAGGAVLFDAAADGAADSARGTRAAFDVTEKSIDELQAAMAQGLLTSVDLVNASYRSNHQRQISQVRAVQSRARSRGAEPSPSQPISIANGPRRDRVARCTGFLSS